MRELSLNILDIVQNSIAAKATLITVEITESNGMLTIGIEDNGCGMTPDQVHSIADPFYTTRTTRRIGLGIPLFRSAAMEYKCDSDLSYNLGRAFAFDYAVCPHAAQDDALIWRAALAMNTPVIRCPMPESSALPTVSPV